MRRKKKAILRILKILALVIGSSFLVYGIFLMFQDDFWRVKRIDCRLNGQECPPEIKGELMKFFQGESILSLSPSEAAEKIKNSPLRISEAVVKKRFPYGLGLVFELEERKPKAAVINEGNSEGGFYLVDQDGFLLEKTAEVPSLPLVFTTQLPERQIGEKFEVDELEKAIFILVDLQLRLLKPKLARVASPREIEVWFEGNAQAIISPQKNLNEQLDSLQLIFSRTKIEGEKPKRIDLRFDKPVISYE